MNKREVGKLSTGFIMGGWLFFAIYLNSWGVGWKFALPLGLVFIVVLWLGLTWVIKIAFEKCKKTN